MCGIAGFVGSKANSSHVERMVATLSHRGPDDHDVWIDDAGGAILGHRRLSIIDLSTVGHQPMASANNRFWITYNGEVYNYQEIKKELLDKGYNFRSHTDTEVVLAAYEHWGEQCPKHLRGMFAFAIWDRDNRTLFLARDRMGIKPLLYAQTGECFIFASEMKAILASGAVKPVINTDALFDYFTFGSVQQPNSFIRGVSSLDAGTTLTLCSDGRIKNQRYWDMASEAKILKEQYCHQPFDELVTLTREKLEEACRLHLVADVRIGSFLSGGIDSTAVTALMSKYASYPIRTFSLGFTATDEFRDELGYAAIAAKHIGSEHTQIVLEGADVARSFDSIIRAIDQPSQDGTNTYFVSRTASQAVKCVLSGLGGDELFAGYSHFKILQEVMGRTAGLTDHALRLIDNLRPNRLTLNAALRTMLPEQQLLRMRQITPTSLLKVMLNERLQNDYKPLAYESIVQQWIAGLAADISQTSLFECHGYLQNTLLRDNDAMSMAHSLEVRPVLLDHKLVEHALALPDQAKIRSGLFKAALTEAVRDLLPPETIARPKMGFDLPLGTWLNTVLKERLHACINDQCARELFSTTFLNRIAGGIGNRRQTRTLWMFLIFQEWYKQNNCCPPN